VIPAHAWAPMQVDIGPRWATIDLGQSERFWGGVFYGSGNYSYHWYVDCVAAPGVNSSLWGFPPQLTFGVNSSWWAIFTPPSTGSYMISFVVEDLSNGVTDYDNATLTVGPPLSVSMSPSSNVTMYVGQSQTFTENTSGGTAGAYFIWWLKQDNATRWNSVYIQPSSVNGNGTLIEMYPGVNSSSWTFVPTSPGTYEIACTVIDRADSDFAYNASQIFHNSITFVTVNPKPIPDPPCGWWLLLYLRAEASYDRWFRPWGVHLAIPV